MQRIKLITKDIKLSMKMTMNTGIDFCWETKLSSLHFYSTKDKRNKVSNATVIWDWEGEDM